MSGNENNLDASAVTPVTVPLAEPDAHASTSCTWPRRAYDYAYTVISTDGGARPTQALANANTVDGPYGPALNGDAAGWASQTFDLSAYAGKSVLVGFRYVSDGGVNDGGWYVDNVAVGGTVVSDGSNPRCSSRSGGPAFPGLGLERPAGPAQPGQAQGVGQDLHGRSFTLSAADLASSTPTPGVALVRYDEPTEQPLAADAYTLAVNGVVQPGGGGIGPRLREARADTF